LGLQLLIPIAARPGLEACVLDAPVGQFYLHGALGAAVGLVVAALLWHVLLAVLRGSDDLAAAAALLGVFLWRGVPLLLAASASALVVRCGRRLGMPGSFPRGLLGSVWIVGLGVVASAWMGEAALAGAVLFSPLAAARLGLGLFQPWWPLRRLIAASGLIVAVSGLLVFAQDRTRQADAARPRGGGNSSSLEGTEVPLGGSQPAVPLR
jgi:hypothetical protein